MTSTRQSYLSGVKTVVVKLGTQLLSNGEGRLDAAYVAGMARQVAQLRQRGIRVTIVSSGAIGAGLREMNLPRRPTDLAALQAIAAIGQRVLMDSWADAFAAYQLPVAQVLLTWEDIDSRTRFLNVRNTIHAIHELGAIPIINENDTISTDELVKITFGDNDILAALVTNALRADLLVLLTVVDGLLDSSGQPVRLIETLDQARTLVRAEKSPLGKGGMNSKLEAARMVTDAGEAMIVADGRMPDVLNRILDSEPVGTLFVPAGRKRPSRARWLGAIRPVGSVTVDSGAASALLERNRSLLAAGIVTIEGDFDRGDCISIRDPHGKVIGRGLSNYAAEDLLKIRGMKTPQIRALLGEAAYEEVIHRNNLAKS
jgi:glutamate 5-kinase